MSSRQRQGLSEGTARALGRLLHAEPPSPRKTPAEDAAELERLLRAVSSRSPAARPRARWGRWLVAAGLALLVGGLAWYGRAGAPLTFAVDGTPRTDGAAIFADPDRAADVRFSDGSTFAVEPGARLRVDASTPSGARLSLVSGRTVAHVVHREKSAWTLHAGPFEIRVTGTRFVTEWDAVRQRLSVDLYEGSVQVVGSSLDVPVAVRAGQRLEAGTTAGNWLLTSLNGQGRVATPAPAMSNSAGSPVVEPAPIGSAEPIAPLAPSAPAPHASDWSALVERADFEGIVREASQLGIERCLSTCSARDVRILADAARYSGRVELAERGLLALRKRGPESATTAAFLLARLEEARADWKAALRWYETYLAEASSGAYAAEALAGKMRMLLRTGDGAESRRAAEAYLSRFPNGVAAATARKILANARNP